LWTPKNKDGEWSSRLTTPFPDKWTYIIPITTPLPAESKKQPDNHSDTSAWCSVPPIETPPQPENMTPTPPPEEPTRFPFDIAAALAGAELVTRDGQKARFIDKSNSTAYPIWACIENDTIHRLFTEKGSYDLDKATHEWDLFLVHPPQSPIEITQPEHNQTNDTMNQNQNTATPTPATELLPAVGSRWAINCAPCVTVIATGPQGVTYSQRVGWRKRLVTNTVTPATWNDGTVNPKAQLTSRKQRRAEHKELDVFRSDRPAYDPSYGCTKSTFPIRRAIYRTGKYLASRLMWATAGSFFGKPVAAYAIYKGWELVSWVREFSV
jgi:hypothetical protein